MDRELHNAHSVGLSVLAGCVFAMAAALGDPFALIAFAIPLGAILGFVCAPAAIYARADIECRRTFLLAVVPTTTVSWAASLLGGPFVAILATLVVYVGSCVGLGLLAVRTRRRLNWDHSNRCTTCGYDMQGLDGVTCPECGRDTTIKPR